MEEFGGGGFQIYNSKSNKFAWIERLCELIRNPHPSFFLTFLGIVVDFEFGVI